MRDRKRVKYRKRVREREREKLIMYRLLHISEIGPTILYIVIKRTSVRVCLCLCLCVRVRVRVRVHVCVYVCIYVCMYLCMYAHKLTRRAAYQHWMHSHIKDQFQCVFDEIVSKRRPVRVRFPSLHA